MSKRKNRAPNLPQETLDRARRQAAGEMVDPVKPQPKEAEPKPVVRPVAAPPNRIERERREVPGPSARRGQPERIQYSNRKERKEATLTPEMVAEALANPYKHVTEEELRSDYGYVLRDLQTMGLLALVLIVVLIALAQFI